MSAFADSELSDTPVWVVYNKPGSGPTACLVGWYNVQEFMPSRIMTVRTFGTELEAKAWIEEFWRAYWTLGE